MSDMARLVSVLNQSPISLRLPASAARLSPERFLDLLLVKASARTGASKNVGAIQPDVPASDFSLSMDTGRPLNPDARAEWEERRRRDGEAARQRQEAEGASEAVTQFGQMTGSWK